MNQHEQSPREDGLSLIELIVAIALTAILSTVMIMILANSWRTQEEVVSVTEATNRGQVVTAAIERAMRNAVEYQVTDSGTVLQVRTSLGGNITCQGFRLAGGEARMTVAAGALGATPSSWPLWQEGIGQRGSTPFFAVTGDAVTYTFDIQTESAMVRFKGEAAPRSVLTGVSTPCW